ncbi:hypothetical protein KY290_027680 [Solanum tuberosum]|uniref:Uncharacterized protein n=1 Tax=Solanum tuberosum TaxID=4113 RepID=A0ABQ7UHI9_SOLTU|nr:hypothetical protein KY290_027680 [Solanum tuberosum]
MGNKYCKKLHPVIAQSKGASTTWRTMIKIRELVEHQIWWQIKGGDSSFWFDNWTTQGELYYFSYETSQEEEIDVKEFADQQGWKVDKLKRWLSEDIVQHILKTIPSPTSDGILDRTWWMLEESRKFTVKSAWESKIRRTKPKPSANNMVDNTCRELQAKDILLKDHMDAPNSNTIKARVLMLIAKEIGKEI